MIQHSLSAVSVPGHPGTDTVVLRSDDITKHYGGIRALQGASIALHAGEIHGLIGENGSGKSTLLGVLSGQTVADSGTITIGDRTIAHGDSRSLRSSVAIVTQELSLAPDLTVAENIFMSHDKPRTWRGINWKALNARAAEALARLNLDIDPATPVSRLRIDQQQLIEIAKAVQLGHPILILDEPTSSLTEDAVEALAQTMRRLRDHGTAVVFVSHRLDEFFALTDRITVLRDGRTVSSRPTAEYTKDSLVEDMLGYAVESYSHENLEEVERRAPLMSVESVCVPGSVTDASFDVHSGEIVGLVGLEGAGRSELLNALFGAAVSATGSLRLAGRSALPRSPQQAMRRGIALVPGDRKNDGLMLEMTIEENVNIARTAGGWRLRPRRGAKEAAVAADVAQALRIQKGSIARQAGSLSGGNQQKVLLGKWIETKPSVMLLDEPTRGVDVGAKREIHGLIRDLRDRGMAVVVSSSDIEELMVLSDRFVVMFRGRIVGELTHAKATQARLSHLATGGSA